MTFMLHGVIVVVRTHPWWLWWPWKKQFMGSYQYAYGAPLWVTRGLIRLEMNFHRDQSRLSFGLANCCLLTEQATVFMRHALMTPDLNLFTRYLHPHCKDISVMCDHRISVKMYVIHFQSKRGRQMTFKNCGTKSWRCWDRNHIWGRRYQSGK